MTVTHGTVTLVLARDYTKDLLIVDASAEIVETLDGVNCADNFIQNTQLVPEDKGLYLCECSVYCDDGYNGFCERSDGDFEITIERVQELYKL